MIRLFCCIIFYTETIETPIKKHKETRNQQNLGKNASAFILCIFAHL